VGARVVADRLDGVMYSAEARKMLDGWHGRGDPRWVAQYADGSRRQQARPSTRNRSEWIATMLRDKFGRGTSSLTEFSQDGEMTATNPASPDAIADRPSWTHRPRRPLAEIRLDVGPGTGSMDRPAP
jgi:hypothetical protein